MRGRLAALAILGAALWALAAEDRPAERSVTGEVVDLSCWLMTGARGEAHRGCAQACLANGSTAAILTDDGQLILTVYDAKLAKRLDLAPYAAQRIEAKGWVYNRAGVTGMVVTGAAPAGERKKEAGEKP